MENSSELTVFWNDEMLKHDPPEGSLKPELRDYVAAPQPHPDSPDRVRNIKHVIEKTLSHQTTWVDVVPSTREQLHRVHDEAYVTSFEEFCAEGGGRLTTYTTAGEKSFASARYAAGAAVGAVEHALEGGLEAVPYALVRPSGHHAQPDTADGYCFFNNVAVAAAQALQANAIDSVAVIDWDVHHGNGTQEIFYDSADVLTVSLHNDHGPWDPDHHPQTGRTEEVGVGDGEGYNVNVPLPPGTGDEGYAYAFETIVEPIVTEYDPDLILVAAGQDPGPRDPLGRNVVSRSGFTDMGSRVRDLAGSCCDGRLALVQEGGYYVDHIGFATLGVLQGVLDTDVALGSYGPEGDPFHSIDENVDAAMERIDEVRAAYGEYWNTQN